MDYLLHLMVYIGIYAILGTAFNLVMGYGGIFSIAPAAFYGLGAYTTALLVMRLEVPWLLAFMLSGLVPALISLLLSAPTLRLRGDYMAIASVGFMFAVYGVLHNWVSLTRGPLGIRRIPNPEIFGWKVGTLPEQLILTWTVAASIILGLWWLGRSPFGRLLKAIRDDEVATRSLGKNVVRIKITVFAISAALAGFAGTLYAQYVTFIHPDNFTIHEAILLLAIVIIGGMGNVWGAVAGAVIMILLPEALRFIEIPNAILGPVRQMIYGAMLILFMILRPEGLIPEHGFRVREVGETRARHLTEGGGKP